MYAPDRSEGDKIVPQKSKKSDGNIVLKRILTLLRLEISAVFGSLMKNHIYTVRRGLAKGLKRKGGLGFIPQIHIPQIVQLTREEKFIMNLDLSDQTVYDIGAAEGLFTIFFARAVGEKGKIVTFEPNQELYKKIIENVKLNKFNHVKARQIALGKERKKETLIFHPLAPECGSIEENEKARILRSKAAKTFEVEVDSLDNHITTTSLPRPDFIKIDVQGIELDVLLGMSKTIQKHKPKLFVEIHGNDIHWRIKNLRKIMKFLIANGYSIYHVESEQMITLYNIKIVKADEHLYCFPANCPQI